MSYLFVLERMAATYKCTGYSNYLLSSSCSVVYCLSYMVAHNKEEVMSFMKYLCPRDEGVGKWSQV